MTDSKNKSSNPFELFSELLKLNNIGDSWKDDIEDIGTRLKEAIYDLTHLTVELKIDGNSMAIRKTELDLISGDVVVTLPAGTKATSAELDGINEKAIKLAREENENRLEKLQNIIEVLIKCLNISPSEPIAEGLKLIQALAKN